MPNLDDFMRQELTAIRAMGELQRSLTGSLAFSLPKIALPQDILGEARIQAMMRYALAQNRMADVAAVGCPSLVGVLVGGLPTQIPSPRTGTCRAGGPDARGLAAAPAA